MKRFGLSQFSALALKHREELAAHALFSQLETLEDLRRFMESHVFAVWDYMCVLKRLQQLLTCVTVPWVPPLSARAARVINQAVLHQESGIDPLGAPASHFQTYHRAMREIGADTTHIDAVITCVEQGCGFRAELAPEPARSFAGHTFRLLERGKLHELAAALCFGREESIPEGLRALVELLDEPLPGSYPPADCYRDGLLGANEGEHTPLALSLLHELCGDDAEKWRDAAVAVDGAVAARLSLWDGIHAKIRRTRSGVRSTLALDEMVAPLLVGQK
jgi:hypothetical protein